jgi:TrmH family RNA methyltransferase
MQSISKAQVKFIRSLQQKKYRDEYGMFVAEGEKCVEELRKAFELVLLVERDGTRAERQPSNGQSETAGEPGKHFTASATEIEQMSGLRTPQGVIAVFRKPEKQYHSPFTMHNAQCTIKNSQLILALDGIQDPGNLGTIIRTCDWFGVHDIICSMDTADCFNPKVVQATMGALARVRVHYVDLPKTLEQFTILSPKGHDYLTESNFHNSQFTIYGTLLDGRDMYEVLKSEAINHPDCEGTSNAIIVMGNEGNGISEAVRSLITHPIRIPSYPADAETSESLNVAIATAIVLAEVRRKTKDERQKTKDERRKTGFASK